MPCSPPPWSLSGASGGIVADPTTVVDVVGDNNLVATPGLYIRGNTVDTTAGVAQVPVLLGGLPVPPRPARLR